MANVELNTAALARLESQLGLRFDNRSLLAHAFVHRSLVNEANLADSDSNERLEFLGDAVLGLIVAQLLYEHYPDRAEGQLSHARASIVSLSALSEMGISFGLGEFIQLGRGENMSGGRTRTSVIGRTFEALLGAIYLDQGLSAVRNLLAPIVMEQLDQYGWQGPNTNFKSHLQEFLQSDTHTTPVYEWVSEQGPDHAKTFEMLVRSGDTVLASGKGSSKQRAEQDAARAALEVLLSSKGVPNAPAAD